ncbi:MAG: hypothetical protein IJO51_07730 [Clostridia bacterium]|nr:hypothetical protein [Clostridia bacterium]
MKSKKAITAAALFLVLLFGISICFLLLPKRGYSDNENRYLTAKPVFSLESLFSGEFTAQYESYVTDGFPFRDMWISVKSRLDLALGRKDTGGVHITDDGWQIEMFTDIDEEQYEKNLNYLRAAKEFYADKLDSFDVMLIPTAAEVLKDKIGTETPNVDQAALLAQAEDLLSADCLAALTPHTNQYIYYRNDHHWTSLGAFYCYEALMGDIALPIGQFTQETLSNQFLGTTFSKTGIWFKQDTIDAYLYGYPTMEHNMDGNVIEGIYDRSYLSVKDKYSVYLSGNQAVTKIDTGNVGDKLILVKDSYANTFVQFLLPYYSEIHVVDLRSFGMSLAAYIEQQEIDDMLVLYNLKGFSEETSLFRITK